jgi:hypothetical protein
MFPDFNEMKERIRRSLSKRSYSYRPLALLEQRRQNISHSSFSSTKQQPQQGTASFRNLLKVITEDEDDALGTSPIGGKDEEENLMNSHLLQSEMTPLNINAINQHHQSHLYHAINYQFIQLMSRSSSHHSPPFSLFQLPSSLPPSQRITAEDIADTDPLSYELEFSQDDYLQYTDLLLALVDSPLLIQNLLSLAEYFLQKKLYSESYFTLLRIVEVTSCRPNSFNQPEEFCLLLLYTIYFTIRSLNYFKSLPKILKLILTLASSSSSRGPSPVILSSAARVYHLLHKLKSYILVILCLVRVFMAIVSC